jgi:hypothetical protein
VCPRAWSSHDQWCDEAQANADQARCKLPEECQNVATFYLSPDDYVAGRVNPVNLKNRLGDGQTDRRNRLRLHIPLLQMGGSINSAHIYGTHVPVEEPSTASSATKVRRSKEALFDHLVGARLHRLRNR